MVSVPLLTTALALAAAPVSAFNFALLGRPRAPLRAAGEDAAQALSDYMAKSHEDKLRAVKAAEDRKNAEIAALKAEIEQLKASAAAVVPPAAPAPAPPVDPAAADLEAKVASYQAFMTEYIVNAQNQKLLLVKEAEVKAEQKFQEKLEQLLTVGGAGPPVNGEAPAVKAPAAKAPVAKAPAAEAPAAEASAAETAPSTTAEETAFQKRDEEIIAAAAAGKSRWGSAEIDRAMTRRAAGPAAAALATAALTPFEHRNVQVAAAGAAGKSRWLDVEVVKARGGAAPAAKPVKEEKAVTLEDRVNLGARLLDLN